MPVTDPPALKPKTKEVWAGLRSLTTMASELQAQIDDLRAALVAYGGYADFLASQESFTDLETNLKGLYTATAEVSDADVAATVDLLESNFASFSDYANDTDGARSKADYDAYRTLLTNNGLSTVQADRHIQLLKVAWGTDAAFAQDIREHADWDALETELDNNGVSASSAAATVDDLRVVFASVAGNDREVLGSSSWSDVETYLANNGLTTTEASDVVDDYKTAYGSTLTSTVKDSFSAWDSYSEFETYLSNSGFTSTQASTFTTKLKDDYDDFDDLRATAFSRRDALAVLLSNATHNTSAGGDTIPSGLKVWEEAGTTQSGKAAARGDVSVRYGSNLYLETVTVPGAETESTGGGDVSYGSIATDDADNVVNAGETVEISATISNTTSDPVTVTAPFVVDGNVTQRKQNITVPASGSRTVAFDFSRQEYASYVCRIGDSGTVTIDVVPAGL